MTKTYFRIQGKGISLAEMQQHNSECTCDDQLDTHPGLCAAADVLDLRRYIKSAFMPPTVTSLDAAAKAAPDLDADFEIVIFRGQRVGEVYDGVLTYPEEIVERVPVSEFFADDRFCDYESW